MALYYGFDFSLVGVSPEKNDKICESKNKSQQTVVKLYGFKETGSLCVKIKNWRMIIC